MIRIHGSKWDWVTWYIKLMALPEGTSGNDHLVKYTHRIQCPLSVHLDLTNSLFRNFPVLKEAWFARRSRLDIWPTKLIREQQMIAGNN